MTTQRAFAEAWAATAVGEIATISDAAYAGWIVKNRLKLGECIKHAPEAHERVKAALAERDRELRAATIRQGIG